MSTMELITIYVSMSIVGFCIVVAAINEMERKWGRKLFDAYIRIDTGNTYLDIGLAILTFVAIFVLWPIAYPYILGRFMWYYKR